MVKEKEEESDCCMWSYMGDGVEDYLTLGGERYIPVHWIEREDVHLEVDVACPDDLEALDTDHRFVMVDNIPVFRGKKPICKTVELRYYALLDNVLYKYYDFRGKEPLSEREKAMFKSEDRTYGSKRS